MLYWLTFLQALPTAALPASPRTDTKAAVLVESPPIAMGNLGGLLFFPGVIAGIVILLLLSIWAYTRVYVITPNNKPLYARVVFLLRKKR